MSKQGSIQEYIDILRQKRKIEGSLRLVELRLTTGDQLINGDLVQRAIQELEQKMLLAAAGKHKVTDDLTALEKLGFHLLTESI